MDVIEDLHAVALNESELQEFYTTLSRQVEEFMCHLLDEVRLDSKHLHIQTSRHQI